MRKSIIPLVLAGLLACPMAWADEVSDTQPTDADGRYSSFYYDGQWSTDVSDGTQWDGADHAHIGVYGQDVQPGDQTWVPLPGPMEERVEVSQDGMTFWSDGSGIGARVDSIPENTEAWDNWVCDSTGNANFWWDNGSGSGQVDYVVQSCNGWNDPEPDPVPDPEPDPEPEIKVTPVEDVDGLPVDSDEYKEGQANNGTDGLADSEQADPESAEDWGEWPDAESDRAAEGGEDESAPLGDAGVLADESGPGVDDSVPDVGTDQPVPSQAPTVAVTPRPNVSSPVVSPSTSPNVSSGLARTGFGNAKAEIVVILLVVIGVVALQLGRYNRK